MQSNKTPEYVVCAHVQPLVCPNLDLAFEKEPDTDQIYQSNRVTLVANTDYTDYKSQCHSVQ